jgi:hypothetical protein
MQRSARVALVIVYVVVMAAGGAVLWQQSRIATLEREVSGLAGHYGRAQSAAADARSKREDAQSAAENEQAIAEAAEWYNDPEARAKAYFYYLKDGNLRGAEKFAAFESDSVRDAWAKQVLDHEPGRRMGRFRWWGEVETVKPVHGPGPSEWASVEVQWRYLIPTGWMPGPENVYMMRTVNGKWKMHVNSETVQNGVLPSK